MRPLVGPLGEVQQLARLALQIGTKLRELLGREVSDMGVRRRQVVAGRLDVAHHTGEEVLDRPRSLQRHALAARGAADQGLGLRVAHDRRHGVRIS